MSFLLVSDRPALPLPPIFDRVRAICPPGLPIWLIGGAVRDALLNRPIHDLDFAVQGNALRALGVARQVADQLQGAFYALDAERGAGRVVWPGRPGYAGRAFVLDFANLRGPNLLADLQGRDFTVNALAVSLHDPERLIDPLGGQADLRARVIKVCSPTAFLDDPVRTLRAIRLAAQFDFRLERETRKLARIAAPGLARASAERIRDEFVRILGGRKPASAVSVLERLGLLHVILPELEPLKGVTQSAPHTLDVWGHTLSVLDRLPVLYSILGEFHDPEASADLVTGLAAMKLGRYRKALNEHLDSVLAGERPARWLLNLAALLHDVRKPQTRSTDADGRIRFFGHDEQGGELTYDLAMRLRLSADEALHLKTIVRHHMRPLLLMPQGQPSRRSIYRYFRDTGEAGVDIGLFSLADMLGTYGVTLPQKVWLQMLDVVAALFEARFRQAERVVAPPRLLTGDDLMAEFQLQSGPLIGELLEAIREAQAAGDVSARAEALELVRQRLSSR